MTHSIILQAICNFDIKFTNCFVGFPGSAHDARVFKNSGIYKEIIANDEMFLSDSYHLLGDSAYPLHKWILVPYKDTGSLDQSQIRYNHKHSQTRIIVECAFALLKGRFRRLRKVISKTDNIAELIMASCVLHNICLQNFDDGDEFVADTELSEHNATATNTTCQTQDDPAIAKRDYIKSIL